MKLSIGNRLFLAMLLSAMGVGAVGLQLVRWTLLDNVVDHDVPASVDRMEGLTDTLAAQYRQHHDWSFLPPDSSERRTWLRKQWVASQSNADATSGARPVSPALEYRIGLLDKDGQYLAGVVANPIMVAFASIDRRATAIVVDGETVGHLIVAGSQNPADELAVAFLLQQQGNLLRIAATGGLLSALAAAVLAIGFRRPIRQLVEGARRLGQAQFDTRLRISRVDELGELAETFNQLAAKLDSAEQSRRQWVADTSHELRTPLSVLQAQLEGIRDGVRAATPESNALMLRQVRSLTKLVDELYELACADIGQLSFDKTSNDAWQLVLDVAAEFAQKFQAAGLTVDVGSAPENPIVFCDADRIRQVVTNLLGNCLRYTDGGGRIEVTSAIVRGELRIAIDDTAPGVPEPVLDRLGERFFRVESSRDRKFGGAGLGLALCKQILTAHSGRLEFAASALGGLRATIVLPSES